MAKRVKRKIKIGNLVRFLVILIIIFSSIYLVLNSNIKNIVITGTKYLSDEEVLKESKLNDYPSFFLTLDLSIKNNLKKNKLIKEVKVKRKIFNEIELNIKEYKIVLSYKDKYVMENGKMIDYKNDLRVPKLINNVDDKILKDLAVSLTDVHEDVLGKISEIEYVPNTYDKGRFLLYMNDSNSVYLTLTKFDKINYYDDVLEQLEGKKGFLYLDSGNHFKIME